LLQQQLVKKPKGDLMPSPTNLVTQEQVENDASKKRRSNISQMNRAARSHFAPLTIEEYIIYRKWRRATLLIYSAFAFVIVAIAFAIGPAGPTTNTRDSALTFAGQPNSH
jgi:hypothetical protein